MPDYRSQGFSVSHPLAESRKRERKRKIATVVDDSNVAYICLNYICLYAHPRIIGFLDSRCTDSLRLFALSGSFLSHSWQRAAVGNSTGRPAKTSDAGGKSDQSVSWQFRQFPI